MKLLLTTNARLYKTPDGKYWTSVVYRYDFFQRYLKVFNCIRLVAHVEICTEDKVHGMIRVDGPNLEVFEVPFPHGKLQYIKKYNSIKEMASQSISGCQAAILRIPDQLAFQLFPLLKKSKIPIGVEVTADSWEYFAKGTSSSIFRPFLRVLWHKNQRAVCRSAEGIAYVTESALQKRYPPCLEIRNSNYNRFTTSYTSADIDDSWFFTEKPFNDIHNRNPRIIHVSTSIEGNAKGHFELLSAIGMLKEKGKEVNLILVGGGKFNRENEQVIEKYKIRNNIRCTGMLDFKELQSEMKEADLFVFPSYREGLPRVVIEAMASGLPCIASDLPGTRELLKEDCLVPVKNTIKLYEKIDELLSNPEKMAYESKINIKVAKKYGRKLIAQKRNDFYSLLREEANKFERDFSK